jgi:hypothetical protein
VLTAAPPTPLPAMRARDGVPILGPELVEMVRRLDDAVIDWAREWDAPEYYFSELLPVAELAGIDYLTNFPHLALCASALNAEALASDPSAAGDRPRVVGAGQLADAEYVLQSAACYNVYFALRGRKLAAPLYLTLVGRCFRREEYYKDFERLLTFRQREIVCVGPAAAVQDHLERCRERFMGFARRLGVDLTVEIATDRFFGQDPVRARMQRLFPSKRELLYDGRLAVASLNAHRNFFGERCEITLEGGEHAFSGCFGLGLERMCGALVQQHGGIEPALARVREVTTAG